MNMSRYGVRPPMVANAPAHHIRADQRGHTRLPENQDERVLHAPMKRAADPASRTPHITAKANPDRTRKEKNVNKWKSSFKPLDGESDEDFPDETADGSHATLRAPEDHNMNVLDDTRSPENYEDGTSHAMADPELQEQTESVITDTAGEKRRNKWSAMFESLEEQIASVEGAESTVDRNQAELYDPFDTPHSDSERGSPNQKLFPSDQDYRDWNPVSPVESHSSNSWDPSWPHQRHDSVPDDLWPPSTPQQSDRAGFNREPLDAVGSISRGQEHRSLSPDRTISRSHEERFSYKEERRNEVEESSAPKYRSEIATRFRLSPPRLKEDYQRSMREVDRHSPPTVETKIRKRSIIMDKNPINCELCDIELASGAELENHLDSKTHWDTMEYIQKENHFDDLMIAFLQEVMLNKCSKCSPDVDPRAIQTLQEKDHMTKVEIFHCAACRVFVSTSVASVQKHITSEEHLFNTQDSEVDRRQACLEKADSMLKQLKPELESFLKGGSPFE